MPKDVIHTFTDDMVKDCKGLRKNVELLQGKAPTYPDAMTAGEILEQRKAARAKSPKSGGHKDMVKHANTVMCDIYFDNMVATYKDKDSKQGLEMYNAYLDEQKYWDAEYSTLPAGVEEEVRAELPDEVRQAKAGKSPMRTLQCLSERSNRSQ